MGQDIHVVENLFTETADGARLFGSKCHGCSTPYFPKSAICHNPECDSPDVREESFGPDGEIWSLAIQDFPPPPPSRYDKPYKPYAMGVVDLDDGLRVLGRIVADDPHSVEVGTRVHMILDAIAHDEDGNSIISWKFDPVA